MKFISESKDELEELQYILERIDKFYDLSFKEMDSPSDELSDDLEFIRAEIGVKICKLLKPDKWNQFMNKLVSRSIENERDI